MSQVRADELTNAAGTGPPSFPHGVTLLPSTIGALTAASNLSDLVSAAAARTNLGLGTAAVKDVPASGDATSGQVVLGTDSRLTDSRVPLAHTQAFSTITALPTTLAGHGITNAYTTAQVDTALALKAQLTGGNSLNGAQVIDIASGVPITVKLAGATMFQINSSGIGFGSTAPSGSDDFMHVQRDVNTSSGMLFKNLDPGNAADAFIHLFSANTGLRLAAQSTALGGNVNMIADAGNVGFNLIQSENAPLNLYTNNLLRATFSSIGDFLVQTLLGNNAAQSIKVVNPHVGASSSAVLQALSDSAVFSATAFSVAAGGAVNLRAATNTSMNIIQAANAALNFYTNNTNVMNLSAAGALTVNGDIFAITSGGVTGAQTFKVSNLNAGAGATAVIQAFADAAQWGVTCFSTAGGAGINLRGTANTAYNILQAANAPIAFYTNNAKRATFDASGNLWLGLTISMGGAVGAFGLQNATTAPASTPAGGGVLYATAGALFWKGSSGTITPLAVA